MTIQVFWRTPAGELELLAKVEANTTAVEDGALVLSQAGADATHRQRVEVKAVFAAGQWGYALAQPDKEA
jgi:hypothetical protein